MTDWIYKLFYADSLKSIVILMIFLIFIWCFLSRYVVKRLRKKNIWKVCNALCCLGMIAIIYSLTIFSRTPELSVVQWIPFYSFAEARTQPELYRSMLMNVFLFFPLGLTLPFALPEKWNRKVLISIIFALTLSISIEFFQYYYYLGRAETDDVLCNSFGAVIGIWSYIFDKN